MNRSFCNVTIEELGEAASSSRAMAADRQRERANHEVELASSTRCTMQAGTWSHATAAGETVPTTTERAALAGPAFLQGAEVPKEEHESDLFDPDEQLSAPSDHDDLA